jgi:ectoine hydroxylase
MAGHRLDPGERDRLDTRGYLVRERVFAEAELARIRAGCEALVERVTATTDPGAPKLPVGSYLFQPNRELVTIVKWEPDQPDVVQGVEPFAHFDTELCGWGMDPRFVDPMKDLLSVEECELFTEKLNLKRARDGGPIVLHQDHPYWVESSEDAGAIATAVLFLDDADRTNGCLEVLPGSHRQGVRAGRAIPGFGRFEMEPAAVEDSSLETLEVPAGSIVFFGSLLVHRSTPNRSGRDRRALLYSYQPAGRRKSHEGLAELLRRGAPRAKEA